MLVCLLDGVSTPYLGFLDMLFFLSRQPRNFKLNVKPKLNFATCRILLTRVILMYLRDGKRWNNLVKIGNNVDYISALSALVTSNKITATPDGGIAATSDNLARVK